MKINKKIKGLLISDSNLENLKGLLNNLNFVPRIETWTAPFGQVFQILVNCNQYNDIDFALVWTRPDAVIHSFKPYEKIRSDILKTILNEVDEYAGMVIDCAKKNKLLMHPAWTILPMQRGLGILNMDHCLGINNILMQMNLRLAERFVNCSNIFMLDTQAWINVVGMKAYNPKLWYMAKIAFTTELFKEAVADIATVLRATKGQTKKLLVLDLDNTLWGGVVGDLGWENIKLGGHDYLGEAFVDFQKCIKALKNRGILLAIVSKNEENIALEAINSHPEMILRLQDFSAWKINWEDKAKNIVLLSQKLNIGLQSIVFIDDNPVERARIKDALPEVFVLEWPEDCRLFARTLLGLNCFDLPSINKEDIEKTELYKIREAGERVKKNFSSVDEWLQTLGIRVTIDELNRTEIKRTIQLLNKTNQMNLTTRRLSEDELLAWVEKSNNALWTFSVADKFGDSGLTGIMSLEITNSVAKIVDFVLSCRVMGRRVEEVMLHCAVNHAKNVQAREVIAEYIKTAKNMPCFNFFSNSGFSMKSKGLFSWDANNDYPVPDFIKIIN